jgi:hypothetical protein
MRPLVTVIQETAATPATPTPPDMPSVIVATAYDVLDYPEDATSILLSSAYGTADGRAGNGTHTPYIPPISGTDVLSVNDGAYPAQSPGAVVDRSSVRVFFRNPRVVLGTTYTITGAPSLGANVTTSSTDQILLTFGVDVVALGIRPGDRVYLTSSRVASEQSVIRTVLSVGEPGPDGYPTNVNALRVTENLPAAGTSTTTWTYDALGEARIERELSSRELEDLLGTLKIFAEPGTNKLTLRGGVTVTTPLTPVPTLTVPSPTATDTPLPLSYAGVYVAYRALRQDLQVLAEANQDSLVSINGVESVTGIGKIDPRNPLAVGVWLALQNSGASPVKYYGLYGDTAAAHASAREAMDGAADLAMAALLTSDLSIINSWKNECAQFASPTFARDEGVPQKFRTAIGGAALETDADVYDGAITGVSQVLTGSASGKFRTLDFDSGAIGDIDFLDVLPGDRLDIGLSVAGLAAWESRRGTHRIAHLNATGGGGNSIIEVEPGTSRWNDTAGASTDDIEFRITGVDGTIKAENLSLLTVSNLGGSVVWAMRAPTLVGGPYTVTYVSGGALAVALSGFAITVTFVVATTTHAQVAAAAMLVPAIAALMTVTAGGVTGNVVAASVAAGILPGGGTTDCDVVANDDLFDQLEDASAAFLTAGVKAGDRLEIPLDPNNYASDAYDSRYLTYVVGSVVSENRLRISNGYDDSATETRELPHYYSRFEASKPLDNNPTGGSIRYRIRRTLTKDEQVTALITQGQSLSSRYASLVYPDQLEIIGLLDGSLPRLSTGARQPAALQPGYYMAAVVAGACAALPVQQGLTNLGFSGVRNLQRSQGYFTERQLARISEGGLMVFVQDSPSGLPYTIHQYTTDLTALETGELSVVRNWHYVARFLQAILRPYLGVYNVLPETLAEMRRAADDGAAELKLRRLPNIGAPLLEGGVETIAESATAADRAEVRFVGRIPRPLNDIVLTLVL